MRDLEDFDPDIWTSAAARRELLALYETRLRATSAELERRRLATRFGETQVLLGGDPQRPVLLLFHGANGDAAQMAGAYAPWCETHRCVFVDVPGFPNPSHGSWIPRGDDSLARWLGELLDALALERASLLGMSAGGYVALRCAAGLGARIHAVVGLVPEGFIEIGELPAPTPDNADAFVRAMTEPDSGFPPVIVELMTRALRKALAAARHPLRLSPLFRREDFAGLEAPVMVVAGGRDRLFPGTALLERARALIPSVRELLLPEINHIHLKLYRGAAIEAIEAFLTAAVAD